MANSKDLLKFGGKVSLDIPAIKEFGTRGQRLAELALLDAHIAPGFILSNKESARVTQLKNIEFEEYVGEATVHIEQDVKKQFNNEGNPLLLKVVESSMLNFVDTIPSIHNIGLHDASVAGFARSVNDLFAWNEYANVVSKVLQLRLLTKIDPAVKKKIHAVHNNISRAKQKRRIAELRSAIDGARSLLPSRFFSDSYAQLFEVLRLYRVIFSTKDTSRDSCTTIQSMVFGNYGDDSGFGIMYTRDFITGEKPITGSYYHNAFDARDHSKERPLQRLNSKYYAILEKLGDTMESHFKEMRQVNFTVENGTLWIIDQRVVPQQTAISELKTLLYLQKKRVIDKEYLVQNISANRMLELLHPTLAINTVQKSKSASGGIAGAIGAAVGRVYFSTPALIESHRKATLHKEDTNFILAMPATFAEDVKAIEVANGVIASEGGYASHAPVVARSLGKVALVNPQIRFQGSTMTIGGLKVKEGDYITMNVPHGSDPTIYLAKGALVKQNPKQSGLLDAIKIIDEFTTTPLVRANADQPKDAEVAKLFGAHGIGLCRTEHMFFNEKRINIFRSMIIATDNKDRIKALNQLERMQADDFYKLLKIMHPLPISIRLLDAPLHEFLPRSHAGMDEFVAFYRKTHPKVSAREIRDRCDLLNEFNPMLGHRGVRLAFTYPEIYKMQLKAILKVVYKLKKERLTVVPEIMIPLVMLPSELKAIRNGKKIEGKTLIGISDIDAEVRKELKISSKIEYKVGTMIELPAAALLSDKIAAYAEFFSFGTNDLTQTTSGLSRDDFNNFYSDYNELDLLESNPFQVLSDAVRELIKVSVQRGRMTRPNLKIGLCGEQGADPRNIPFMIEAGLDYVSCSPYGIPIAKLALAHYNIKNKDKDA